MDFLSLDTVRNRFLLLKPPSLIFYFSSLRWVRQDAVVESEFGRLHGPEVFT